MKIMKGKISIAVFICLITVLFQSSVISSTSDQDRARDFVEDVLPIDSSLWHIELKVESNATGTRERLDKNNISALESDRVLIYFLGSMVGTTDGVEAIFIIRESQFIQSVIDIRNAPSYSTFRRPLEVVNVTNFLVKYQSWSGLDSAEMIDALANVDLSHNASVSSGNLTMNITKIDACTKISWMFPDLRKFEVSFQNYFPTGFYDERQLTLIPTPAPTITQHPTVNTGEIPPQTEPFPTAVVIGAVIIVAVVGVGLLVYYKKSWEDKL